MSNKDYFSIGEISKAVGITRKTILNYEAKGLIKPDKKDGVTGNRYYTIDTFTQIRTIRNFQELGLSLAEIRKYFSEAANLNAMIERLEAMKENLIFTIKKLKERTQNNIETITVEPQKFYCRVYNTVTVEDKTNLLRDTALEAMKSYGTNITRWMYFTEYSINNPSEISYCVAVPLESEGEYIRSLPSFEAVSVIHHGAYESIPETRKILIAYAEENNIKLSGVFRHIYIEGPPQHKDQNKFITQVIAMIEQR